MCSPSRFVAFCPRGALLRGAHGKGTDALGADKTTQAPKEIERIPPSIKPTKKAAIKPSLGTAGRPSELALKVAIVQILAAIIRRSRTVHFNFGSLKAAAAGDTSTVKDRCFEAGHAQGSKARFLFRRNHVRGPFSTRRFWIPRCRSDCCFTLVCFGARNLARASPEQA
jgi:hypothetical protein